MLPSHNSIDLIDDQFCEVMIDQHYYRKHAFLGARVERHICFLNCTRLECHATLLSA